MIFIKMAWHGNALFSVLLALCDENPPVDFGASYEEPVVSILETIDCVLMGETGLVD